MTGERVLLVDDEEEFVQMLAKRMSARGLRVETAGSGEEAVEVVRRRALDVVVLDLAMPGMDGIETLRRVLEIDPDLQVILLTGHGTISKGVEAMKLGAADFLEKPAKLSDLLECIHAACEKRALLIEERTEKRLSEILRKKGW